jgi:hypothetical protein
MAALVAANVLATWAHYFGWLMVGLEIGLLLFAVAELLRPVRAKVLAAAGHHRIAQCNRGPAGHAGFTCAADSLGRGTWLDPPTWEEPYNMLLRLEQCARGGRALHGAHGGLGRYARAQARSMPSWPLPLWWTLLPLGRHVRSSPSCSPCTMDRYSATSPRPAFYLLVAMSAAGATRASSACAFGCCTGGRGARHGRHLHALEEHGGAFTPQRVKAQGEPRGSARKYGRAAPASVVRPDLCLGSWTNCAVHGGIAPIATSRLHGRGIFHPVQAADMPALDSTVATVVHIDSWASLTDPGHEVLNELRKRYTQVDSVEADKKVMVRRFRKR